MSSKPKRIVESKIKDFKISEIPIWATISTFAILTIIFFSSQLFGNSFFWEDFVEYVYPVQSYAASESAKLGGVPFWNPNIFAGMPFFADLQVGFFYPFNRLLNLFISNGAVPVGALQFIIILHFFIAQISFYFLAKEFKISDMGAIIGSISFGFSMLLVCQAIHPMVVYHLSFFPLVVAFFLKGITRQSFRYASMAGLLLGITLLSGHPQTTLYEGIFLFILYIWKALEIYKSKVPMKTIALAKLCGIIPIILAGGIFAIQLLPSLELAKNSQRKEASYKLSTEGSLQFKQIVSTVIPKVFGTVDGENEANPSFYLKFDGQFQRHLYWETVFYFGIVTLFLGLLGAVFGYKNSNQQFLIFISLFGFLFALGSNGFLYDILYKLPLIGTFRNPARMMFFMIIGFSLLAGFGFDSIFKKENDKGFLLKLLIALAFPTLIAFLGVAGAFNSGFEIPQEIQSIAQESAILSLFFIIVLLVIVYLAQKRILSHTIAGIIFSILAFSDLYINGNKFNSNSKNPAETFVIDTKFKELFSPKSIKLPDRNSVNEMYNVKYEIAIDSIAKEPRFFERESFMPRAWLVTKAHILNEEQIKESMKSQKFNLKKEVILEKNPNITLSNKIDSNFSGKVTISDYESNKIVLTSTAKENSVLVMSEIYYPDWKAYIDGKETEVLRADYCFRAIPITAGNHTIELKFESKAYASGKMISIITMLLALGLLFVKDKKNVN
ncbi:MAG: YfhO family protein [Candidatus Kapabacteria bacterium]|nr:YfhO family protein [Candidatus Kapabacteria bacterium]